MSHKRFWNQVIVPKFEFLKHINSFFYYVVVLLALGFGFFGYALVNQNFTTPYGGDFSQQGLTFCYNFYDSWWTFFRTGNFPNFVHNVFIGNDNIQANTFYGLFSPFIFPMLFFPRDWLPQTQALMSVARLVVGGLLFRVYLKYLGAEEKTARLFSIAYAFTGWIAYFLWFNSFYEVLSFFPLVLFGVEKVIKEKHVWALTLGMFLLGISNYFFLLTAGIFGAAYAVFRFFQTIKDRKTMAEHLQVIGFGFAGFLLGSLSSLVVVLPAVISSFGIERSTSSLYITDLKSAFKEKDWDELFKLLFYSWNTSVANSGTNPANYMFSQYFPLASFFYPTISDRFTNIIHYRYFENSATSIFVYTPVMIMFFASIYKSFKDRKVSHFIAIAVLSICLFVPFFYFLCGMFSNVYGRWEIVVSISIITYAALGFDKRKEIGKPAIAVSGIIIFVISLVMYFVAVDLSKKYTNILDPNEYIGLVIYQLILVALETLVFTFGIKTKHIYKFMGASLAVEVVVMGTLVAMNHGLQSIYTSVNGGYNNVPTEQALVDKIKKDDNSFYRIQSIRAKDGNPNLPLTLGYNGVSTFHSFYNNYVDDFQRFSLVLKGDTSWSGTAFSKRTNLDEFLGVKYYISKDSETSYTYTRSDGTKYSVVFNPNIPLGFEKIIEENGYRVYKNQYHLNFATSHDTFYYKNSCAGTVVNTYYADTASDVIRNEEMYFKGTILDNDDIYDIRANHLDAGFNYVDTVPGIDATRLYYKAAKIYKNPNGKSFDPKDPDRDYKDENIVTTTDKNVSKWQIVLEPQSGTYFDIGEKGGCYMLDYPVATSYSNYNASIWLIGEDDTGKSKVITYDECRYNQRNDGKTIRELYSIEKVKRIVILPTGGLYRLSPALYYEPFEKCIDRYQKAMENGVNNVKLGTDYFSFESNYEKERYIVTQVAYTPGWKVKAIEENGNVTYPKVYNSQGGFVGFVAPKGKVKYEMTYMTPYTGVGAAATIFSVFGTAGLTILAIRLNKKKKSAEADNIQEEETTN